MIRFFKKKPEFNSQFVGCSIFVKKGTKLNVEMNQNRN